MYEVVTVSHPGGPGPGTVPFPVHDFQTDVVVDDIVEAMLDPLSGSIAITLNGIAPAAGDEVTIYLRDRLDDSVLAEVTLSPVDVSATLDLAGVTVTPLMYLDGSGSLEFTSAADGEIVVEAVGSFLLSEVVLNPADLGSRFPAVDVKESERFELSGDLQIETIALDLIADVDYRNFSAQNLQILLHTRLTGYDRLGGTVRWADVKLSLSSDVAAFDELAAELTELLKNPSVREIELYVDQVTVEAPDPHDRVRITFMGDPSVLMELSYVIGGPDVDVALGFNSRFTTPEGMPAQVEGGVIAFTIENRSPVDGRLDFWFTEIDPPALSDEPDMSLRLRADSGRERFEVSLDAALLEMLRTSDEGLVTVRLAQVSTTRPVRAGDAIIIDAQAKIAGRVNR